MNTNSKNCNVEAYLKFFAPHIINKDIRMEYYDCNVPACKFTSFPKNFIGINHNIYKITLKNLFPYIIYKTLKDDEKLKCSIDYFYFYEFSESKEIKKYINMIYGMQNHPKNNVKFNFNLKNSIFMYLNNFHNEFKKLDINKYLILQNTDIYYFMYPAILKLKENSILESYFFKHFEIELINTLINFGNGRYIEFKDNNLYVTEFRGIRGIKKVLANS